MAITAVPLGPGWSGCYCVPGPSFKWSGFSDQAQSGLGRVMPITHDVAKDWAHHGLVLFPSLGGWWPSRSLVVRRYADAFNTFSLCHAEYYCKANDQGAFDLAMPVDQSRSCGAAYSWGGAAVARQRYEKVYVRPPQREVGAYDFREELMESAAH